MTAFFCEQRPVGRGVNDHGLKLAAHHATFSVDLFNGHQRYVFQYRFRDRHRAGEGVQHTHFDWIFRLSEGQWGQACSDDGGSQRLDCTAARNLRHIEFSREVVCDAHWVGCLPIAINVPRRLFAGIGEFLEHI